MKKMTKFFALALLAGAMVSCSTEDTAPSTQNDKVAVQFTGGISVNTRASGLAWADGDMIGIFMTGANQTLSADAIKEGADNVCYQTGGSVAFSPISGGKTIYYPIDGDVDFYSYLSIYYGKQLQGGTQCGQPRESGSYRLHVCQDYRIQQS